jgi:hypothetical protein
MKINSEQENQALKVYHTLYQGTNHNNTKVYLQETVDSSLDIGLYLEMNHMNTSQKVEMPGMISVSGYRPGLPGGVKTGEDMLNFQVMVKDETEFNKGKAMVTLPALLEEF